MYVFRSNKFGCSVKINNPVVKKKKSSKLLKRVKKIRNLNPYISDQMSPLCNA